MKSNSIAPSIKGDMLYISLFEALRSNSVLVKNDCPRHTIIAATPAYLRIVGYQKENLVGKGFFEAFPFNNTDPANTGINDVFASYNYVMQHKESHFLPVQRYDLQNEDGSFTEKY